ncbi:MAG TPA: hypothetical protein VK577_16100, partial [Bradyrhizobium sp.]|nr:hypothetical protein [Bradyrhizobium sp.]
MRRQLRPCDGREQSPCDILQGKTLAAGFCGTLFHGRLQSNTFNRADFRKVGMAKDEARLAAFSGRALLLWHVRNLPHIFPLAMPSRMSVAADDDRQRGIGPRVSGPLTRRGRRLLMHP